MTVDTSGIDWARFLTLCGRHRIEGLAHDSVANLGVEVPEPVATDLAAEASAIVAQNLQAIAESKRLLKAFNEAATPVLFVDMVSPA